MNLMIFCIYSGITAPKQKPLEAAVLMRGFHVATQNLEDNISLFLFQALNSLPGLLGLMSGDASAELTQLVDEAEFCVTRTAIEEQLVNVHAAICRHVIKIQEYSIG